MDLHIGQMKLNKEQAINKIPIKCTILMRPDHIF